MLSGKKLTLKRREQNVADLVVRAILDHSRLEIVLSSDPKRTTRKVEPYACYDSRGEPMLSVYQTEGYTSSSLGWKTIKVAKIESISILFGSFDLRDGYNPDYYKNVLIKIG